MFRKSQTKPDLMLLNSDRLLTPAEKAKQLGVSADTLRRWENEGRIESTRTAGGQRRYRADALPQPSRRWAASSIGEHDEDDLVQMDVGGQQPAQLPTVTPWQARVEERRADLEIAKLDREHRAMLRAEAQEREERRRQREDDDRRALVEQERRAAELRESQRLERLVQRGMLLAVIAPFEFQAMARRELLAFVTSERFPAHLSFVESDALLRARVEQVLKPWRDRRLIEELLQKARSRATLGTMGSDWEFAAAQKARREVETKLSREIDPTWTKHDVQSRVDEILDEWE